MIERSRQGLRALPPAGVLLLLAAAGAAQQGAPENRAGTDAAPRDPALGVLVMAHGGPPDWNAGVLSAVEPLRDDYRIDVAFGMADAASLQRGIAGLEAAGAERIAVIRLFISGDSWYERTRQILGLADGAPPRPPQDDPTAAGDAAHAGHSMEFWRVDAEARFVMSREGLGEADEMSDVVVDRVRALSTQPPVEDVLLLAHGPQDDAENERWLAQMRGHAERVRAELGVHATAVETLREDWPDKRAEAEGRIRAFVTAAADEGRTVIVVPFRVHGFGPYAEVLDGLEYVADGRGLVPHEAVTRWIERQIGLLIGEGAG